MYLLFVVRESSESRQVGGRPSSGSRGVRVRTISWKTSRHMLPLRRLAPVEDSLYALQEIVLGRAKCNEACLNLLNQ